MKQTLGRQVVSTVPVKHILLLQCGPQAGAGPMAAVRHLDVSKFGIVVMYPVLERDSALSYKISR